MFLLSIISIDLDNSYELEDGDYVKLSGEVTNLTIRGNVVMFDLSTSDLSFRVISTGLELRNGMKIHVEGEYKKGSILAKQIIIK